MRIFKCYVSSFFKLKLNTAKVSGVIFEGYLAMAAMADEKYLNTFNNQPCLAQILLINIISQAGS